MVQLVLNTLVSIGTTIYLLNAVFLSIGNRLVDVASCYSIYSRFRMTLCRVYESRRCNVCRSKDTKLDGFAIWQGLRDGRVVGLQFGPLINGYTYNWTMKKEWLTYRPKSFKETKDRRHEDR